MVSDNLKIVILAGGAGTRLWPMSTKKKPKQFQKLVSEKTMLQETFARVSFVNTENIYVSTNEEYVQYVKEQLPNLPEENIIAEPCLRDTAPCIGLVASLIGKNNPDTVMAIVYADHLVKDENEFREKLLTAKKLAEEENTLNIIEVEAKTPNTNLGYVRIGKTIKTISGTEIKEFKEFKEKPDLPQAKKFVASGEFLWNTGFYVWRTERILKEFEKHMPKTYLQLLAIRDGADPKKHYPLCEKSSIDYGIMEKADPKDVRIIPAQMGWSDIGTWETLYEELAKNPEDNVKRGRVLSVDSKGNLIYNEGGKEIVTFGLKNTIVVKHGEHLLICPREKSNNLKSLLEKLK